MSGFGYISDYFTGVASKRLTAVEIDPSVSRQHEFNGVAALKLLWGTETIKIPARFLYLGDDDEDRVNDTGNLTWYDSRKNQPKRSPEFRLYYEANDALPHAAHGDLAIVAKRRDESAVVIVAKQGSTYESRLIWLFDLEETVKSFTASEIQDDRNREADYLVRSILEELEIETEPKDTDFLDVLLGEFGADFPTTEKFSAFARSTVHDAPVKENPDAALMLWFEREELLFRTLEQNIVAQRLEQGFADVDDFISYSLSVHNRRKSRVGYALEHHLACIFTDFGLRFSRHCRTENRVDADFMFPGKMQYHDPEFPAASLTMLGVKSTCKDRWRQVLSEADRIKHKHLFTLEGGISVAQTTEMKSHSLSLVLPAALHRSFRSEQQEILFSLRAFIDHVAEKSDSSVR